MSGVIYLKEGTGLTSCKLCGKQIKKGQKAIAFSAYNTSGQVHSKPEECKGSIR